VEIKNIGFSFGIFVVVCGVDGFWKNDVYWQTFLLYFCGKLFGVLLRLGLRSEFKNYALGDAHVEK
jgi:uncharacterized oligopeptide transporter (OPT) family protein